VGRETLRTGGKILSDIAERYDVSVGDIVSKHVTESALMFISKLRGRGSKGVQVVDLAGGKRRRKERAMRKIIKSISFPSFTLVNLKQSFVSAAVVEIASVSSMFDIFAHRSIQTSLLGTTEVALNRSPPSIKMIWNF